MNHEPTQSLETQHWIQQRQRPGNWFDIIENDEIPPGIVGSQRTILHMFQIAFAPEIRRRISSGQLGDYFFLNAAQLVQPEHGENTVRLNDEIRGLALVRASRTVHKGEQAFLSDLKGLVSFDLAEDELDSGHFTMLWDGEGWFVTFDFRAGRAKCSEMLKNASEFLEVATLSSARGFVGPSVDNLFSACELVSKAHLILHRSPGARSRKHGPIRSAINNWRRFGNVNEEFVNLFNQISAARSPARYNFRSRVQLPSQSDLLIVEREINNLMKQVSHRTGAGALGT